MLHPVQLDGPSREDGNADLPAPTGGMREGNVYHAPLRQLPARMRGGRGGGATLVEKAKRIAANPSKLWPFVNARLRMRGVEQLPASVRLVGRAVVGGGGRITLGERVLIIGRIAPVEISAWRGGRVEIGDGTFINNGTSIAAHQAITIGSGCQIGQYVIINDNNYHTVGDLQRLPPSEPVVIGDRVWLGARAIVLKGVHIGHDAVVGAGSVVTKDVPPRCVVAGVPAQVVSRF